jgi:hypothetical protein
LVFNFKIEDMKTVDSQRTVLSKLCADWRGKTLA